MLRRLFWAIPHPQLAAKQVDDRRGINMKSITQQPFHHAMAIQTEASMKRIAIAVGLVVLLFAVVLQAQAPAPKPGPEHKKLEIWVGDWTYDGEANATPFGPAGKVSGKNSTKPILGGFFVEFRGEDKGTAGTTHWVEIDGYDPVTKKFTWNNFASDGSVQSVTYTMEGKTMSYSGTQVTGGKQAKIRGTCVFTPDFMSNVDKREITFDGKAWMPLWEGKATKLKSSPK